VGTGTTKEQVNVRVDTVLKKTSLGKLSHQTKIGGEGEGGKRDSSVGMSREQIRRGGKTGQQELQTYLVRKCIFEERRFQARYWEKSQTAVNKNQKVRILQFVLVGCK